MGFSNSRIIYEKQLKILMQLHLFTFFVQKDI